MKISRARDLQTPLQRGSSRQAFTWVPRGWRGGKDARENTDRGWERELSEETSVNCPRHAGEESRGCPKLPASCCLPWDTSSGLMFFI